MNDDKRPALNRRENTSAVGDIHLYVEHVSLRAEGAGQRTFSPGALSHCWSLSAAEGPSSQPGSFSIRTVSNVLFDFGSSDAAAAWGRVR